MAFRWSKLGLVFSPGKIEDRPWWMNAFAQAPASVVHDEFVRIYFSCRPAPEPNGQFRSYSAFVDLDRDDITKIVGVADQPILSLGERGTFDEFGTYPVSVLREGSTMLAYYGGWTRCASVPFDVAIGCARSEDGGRTFRKLGCGPVLGAVPDEPFVLSGPKIRRFNDRLHLFYIAGRAWKIHNGRPEPIYKIRSAISRDGVNWERLGHDLIPSRIEPDEAQASPDVIRIGNKYHMFFCYRRSANYRGSEGGYRIGYASSTDLIHWERNDDLAGITPSDDGWDGQMVSYPHVFEVNGQIYMAYLGNDVGKEGFGLAKLEGFGLPI